MRTLIGNLGFQIEVRDDGSTILNDPRICEALEAAVKDSDAICIWKVGDSIRIAEVHGSIPTDAPVNEMGMLDLFDYNTSTFGQGKTLTEALRWFLGYFWVKGEDV